MEPHLTEGLDCWCEPMVTQRCPDCISLPESEGIVPGCRACRFTAWVRKFNDEGPFLVVHRGPGGSMNPDNYSSPGEP